MDFLDDPEGLADMDLEVQRARLAFFERENEGQRGRRSESNEVATNNPDDEDMDVEGQRERLEFYRKKKEKEGRKVGRQSNKVTDGENSGGVSEQEMEARSESSPTNGVNIKGEATKQVINPATITKRMNITVDALRRRGLLSRCSSSSSSDRLDSMSSQSSEPGRSSDSNDSHVLDFSNESSAAPQSSSVMNEILEPQGRNGSSANQSQRAWNSQDAGFTTLDGIYRCNSQGCEFASLSPAGIKSHFRSHNLRVCGHPGCQEQFTGAAQRQQHVRRTHRCEVCGGLFLDKSDHFCSRLGDGEGN